MKRSTRCALTLTLYGALTLPALATSLQQVQLDSQKTLQQEQASQKKVEQWNDQRQALINELLDQKTQLEWNRFQNKKFNQYVVHKQHTLEDLSRQKEQMTLLRKELEPYLDTTVATLHQQVATDLPFLIQERRERLAFLDQSLTDPELALSEKLRRVLEALQVEADYGNSVEVTTETLSLNATDTRVQMLRLGRLGLFYLTQDGHHVGHWDNMQQRWLPLEDHYQRTVQKTIDVIEQTRAAELIDLPLPLAARSADKEVL